MKKSILNRIAYALLVIGGLNWAAIGFFNYNFVDKVFSADFARIIYCVVGVAAVYGLFSIMNTRARTKTD